MGCRGKRILGWFRFWSRSFCSSDILRVRRGWQVFRREGGTTIPGVVSSLSASEASAFLHACSLFNRSKLRQGDSIDLHSIGVALGAGRVVRLGWNASCSKGEDSHFLGMENLGLINPSCTGGGDSGHGKDHGSDLLV